MCLWCRIYQAEFSLKEFFLSDSDFWSDFQLAKLEQEWKISKINLFNCPSTFRVCIFMETEKNIILRMGFEGNRDWQIYVNVVINKNVLDNTK
jgi:hypothetical protein